MVDELRNYQRFTGVPISKSVEEAVRNFIECSLTVRISRLLEEVKEKQQRGAKLTKLELELLSRLTSNGALHLHNKERTVKAYKEKLRPGMSIEPKVSLD